MIRLIICTIVVMLNASALMTADDYEERIRELFERTKSQTYAAQAFTAVIPYAVGQWVMYGHTDDDGERSIVKYSIVGKEGDEWTIETMIMDEDDIIVTQYVISGFEDAARSGNPEDIEFRKIRMRPSEDDDIVVIEGFVLDLAKGAYKDALKSWFHSNSDLSDGGSATVPAGTFAGTTKARSVVTIFGETVDATSWLHPAVPIHGLVKSENTDGYTSILLDFGMEGAVSSLD